MTKNLNILLGDDQLLGNTIFFFEKNQAKKMQDALPDYKLNWEYEINPEKVISKAKTGNYNIVVTDLDYGDFGDGSHKDGYQIIDAVCTLNPKPLLVLCTSTKESEEMRQKVDGKADFIAGPEKGHKFDSLADILIKHFQENERRKIK